MKSSSLYLASRILIAPQDIFFTLLIFILSKSLNATTFQLTLIACIKPITSLFAFYLSTLLYDKPHRIRLYLMINLALGAIPCFFYPFIDNIWFYIASYTVHMITRRAQDPAWIEILKRDLAIPPLSQLVSRGSSIYYCVSMALPPLLSFWMDRDAQIWRILFCSFATLQLLDLFVLCFLMRVPEKNTTERVQPSLSQLFVDPLKNGWELLKRNPPFSHYLTLFLLGGIGIIATQPLLPKYFQQNLNLSYTELTLAFSFCKGISFVLSSPIWSRAVLWMGLYRLNALMDIFTSLFFGGVLLACFGVEWLYLGYLFYGMMQGGCELTWNLSGPVFAKNKDSTPYSSLNLILIGVRGCICPFLGYLLSVYISAIPVFGLALTFCLLGALYGLWLDAKYRQERVLGAV
jgi:hypothetical protein